MRLLIVGTLKGQLTTATKIAMDKGAAVTHAESISQAMAVLRGGRGGLGGGTASGGGGPAPGGPRRAGGRCGGSSARAAGRSRASPQCCRSLAPLLAREVVEAPATRATRAKSYSSRWKWYDPIRSPCRK